MKSARDPGRFILVGTRLRPPSLRSALVSRERLVKRLGASDVPIGLVVAPPGFGKTTLLVQWQSTSERPVAWLSLDEDDNDPLAFWSSVVASIDRVVPGFAGSVLPTLTSMGGLALEAVVARILNELDALAQPVSLVLDDYHRIRNPECHDAMALLLERLPPSLQLIISTRVDPPLPMARWKANGRVIELRAADLGFTGPETEQALNQAWGLDLSADEVAVLRQRTEGWPAGLYLACLSIRGASDGAALMADFGGATRLVIDYLMEVVLEQQDDAMAAFLMQTSVLEGLSASLCNAVTGRNDSEAILVRLERENLFIVALDDRREWFRYHHLFAQALNEELHRRHTSTSPSTLHGRAAAWFEAKGDFGQAIRHAFAGGDLEQAATLVATHWWEAVNRGRLSTVFGWLASFPRPVLEADARLLLVQAWLYGLEDNAERALQAISAAQRIGFEGELPDGTGNVDEGAALVRATFAWSDVGAMLSAARVADARQYERQTHWAAVAALDLGWALILSGQPEQAREPLKRSLALATRHELGLPLGDAAALLAEVALDAGDLDQAETWIADALAAAKTYGFSDLPQVGQYHATAGTIRAHRGDFEAADRLISAGVEQMRGSWEPLHVAQALLSLASVRRALGGRAEARALLHEARVLIQACRDPGALADRLDQATHAVESGNRRADPDTKLTERELEVLNVLAKGATERQAAAQLFVSPSTIHSHTKSVYLKLGCSSRDEAVARARERGLIGQAPAHGQGVRR